VDTREKILTVEQLMRSAGEARATGRAVRVVTGYFDPLLPEHARRLAELGQPGGLLIVIVVVTDPPQPILPARARAELVAALRVVDGVLTARPAEVEDLLGQIRADAVAREEPEDLRRARDFATHVRARQGG
jgi:glycerol-3-phosphate cytidylyltransferase-like family protein